MSSAQYNKQSQIVQNFFSKSAQVIAEARLAQEELRAEDTGGPQANINKWFNLELKELDFLHESLRPWMQVSADEVPPPLVVECYLNPSKLRPGQTVVLGDVRCSTNQEIVLERWVIEFKPAAAAGSGSSGPSLAADDLPAVYKRAIISIRSLYTAVRLLPTWQLHQRLSRQKLISVPLKLGIKIHNGALPINSRGRVGLSKSIAGKRSTLQQFRIQPVSMPLGTLHCGVTSRTDVGFGVEDIEKVMAQKFMELDSPQASGAGSPFGAGSHTSTVSFQPGSQGSLGPRPILSFTRPFKSPDAATGFPHSIPSSVNSTAQFAPQSIVGSASSAVSANSRFSSSFASQRAHALPPRSLGHESQIRAASVNSQGSHDSYHNSLDPGSGMYMAQSDIGDFVKFVDETRKKGSDRIRPHNADVDSTLARFQSMKASQMQLSESIIQGSGHSSGHGSDHGSGHGAVPGSTLGSGSGHGSDEGSGLGSVQSSNQETVRPDRRRGSGGPRSRLGFYPGNDGDEGDEGDSDMLFALSDMHI